jgi:hypothetical protein
MACTSYCGMQTAVNDRTVGIFLHSDFFRRYKSVFAVTGDLQMRVILHLLKFYDRQNAVYATALKLSHFKHIFGHSVKLYSVLILNPNSVINLLILKIDLNNIKNRVSTSQRTHCVSNTTAVWVYII